MSQLLNYSMFYIQYIISTAESIPPPVSPSGFSLTHPHYQLVVKLALCMPCSMHDKCMLYARFFYIPETLYARSQQARSTNLCTACRGEGSGQTRRTLHAGSLHASQNFRSSFGMLHARYVHTKTNISKNNV